MNFALALLGLTMLQIVLSVDNVIFLSIVTQKLPDELKAKARKIGVVISMCMNAVLILSAGMLSSLNNELFTANGRAFNLHDIILIGGGLFLVYKAIKELFQKIEGKHDDTNVKSQSLGQVILAMVSIDFIFSIDSTITAIGMSNIRTIQVVSMMLAILSMYFFFNLIAKIIAKHPSFNIIALAFLVLIGFSLFVEGMGIAIPKGYIYFAMIFSLIVEAVNIRFDKNSNKPN